MERQRQKEEEERKKQEAEDKKAAVSKLHKTSQNIDENCLFNCLSYLRELFTF